MRTRNEQSSSGIVSLYAVVVSRIPHWKTMAASRFPGHRFPLSLITPDDWTGQDSLVEEFPLSNWQWKTPGLLGQSSTLRVGELFPRSIRDLIIIQRTERRFWSIWGERLGMKNSTDREVEFARMCIVIVLCIVIVNLLYNASSTSIKCYWDEYLYNNCILLYCIRLFFLNILIYTF